MNNAIAVSSMMATEILKLNYNEYIFLSNNQFSNFPYIKLTYCIDHS